MNLSLDFCNFVISLHLLPIAEIQRGKLAVAPIMGLGAGYTVHGCGTIRIPRAEKCGPLGGAANYVIGSYSNQ